MNRPALETLRERWQTRWMAHVDLHDVLDLLDALLAPDAVSANITGLRGEVAYLSGSGIATSIPFVQTERDAYHQARAQHVATMRCENCGGHDLVDQGRGLYYCALANWSA